MRNYWSSRLSDVVVVLLLVVHAALAQFSKPDSLMPAPDKTVGSYMFPIQPGKTAMLTGTMGELRSSHFHGGLDINTVTIGYAVRCANDGYIANVRMSTSGYGNSIIVRHRDGNATLYAHLDKFLGPVADHVRSERYKRKQSEIDLDFAPNQFPVERGDTLALSGNTGSSGGPHLHFELRDSNNEALNPMTLGFEEIQDHVAPVVQRVALRTLDADARINDEFGRFEFHAPRKGKNYVFMHPILASGRIGIEIQATDRSENSTFKFGINLIEVFANGAKVFSQHIDRINFQNTRNILAVMDYPTLETRGARFNKLYVDDGNSLPYYEGSETQGIHVTDQDVNVEIVLNDFHGNKSTISLTLKPSPSTAEAIFLEKSRLPYFAEMRGHTLMFSSDFCVPLDTESGIDRVDVFSKGNSYSPSPAYTGKTRSVYLLNLDNGLPDSIVTCNGTWISGLRVRVPSGIDYKYFGDLMEVEFPKSSIYDTLYLNTSYDSTSIESFVIGKQTVPLHTPVRITLKPLKKYVVTKNLGVYRQEGADDFTYLGGNWKNGKVSFNSLALGKFAIMRDTVPPSITPISLNGAVARLRSRDWLSGISYFEASIDGRWLLMNYDYKTGVLYSERLDRSKPLKGDFELKVVDQAGNETVFKSRIP